VNDPVVVRIVTASLGVVLLASLLAAYLLESDGTDAGVAGMVATGALGALAGILSNSATRPDPTVGAAMDAAADAGRARAEADLLNLSTTVLDPIVAETRPAAPEGPARKRASARTRLDKGRTDLVTLGVFLLLLACALYVAVLALD
jgi:hypothetical protein